MRIILTGIQAFDERLMAATNNAERIEILNQCAASMSNSPDSEQTLEKVKRYIAEISEPVYKGDYISSASVAALPAVKPCPRCQTPIARTSSECRACAKSGKNSGILSWCKNLLSKSARPPR